MEVKPLEVTADFIVPCFNEGENVKELVSEFDKAFNGSPITWRLIMVDDGSSDNTWTEIESLCEIRNCIAGIRFSRNFGKEAAIYAGLEHADADYVGIIDADLQQPPAIAREMLEILISSSDADCVAAYQDERKENIVVSLLKKAFYKVFSRAMSDSVIRGASDFRVFKRDVALAILELPEYYRFSKGIFSWIGFEVIPFPYVPDERIAGESKWSVGSLFRYAFEGLLSFSTEPLHFITKTGIAVSCLALIYAIYLIVKTFVMGVDVPGYATIVCLILLLGGGEFFALGVIGEYLSRAYVQGKRRPIYLAKTYANIKHSQGVRRERD